jgi:hypothetical protein
MRWEGLYRQPERREADCLAKQAVQSISISLPSFACPRANGKPGDEFPLAR